MGHSPQADCVFRSDTGDNGGRAALLPLAPFLFRIFKAQFIAIWYLLYVRSSIRTNSK